MLNASPCAYGGSGFVFQARSTSEFGLHHDAFVGLVCGLNAVPTFARLRGQLLHDCVDDSSFAWRGVADPLTNLEFVLSHGKPTAQIASAIHQVFQAT
jgi:hypothetical protein